MNQRQGLVLVAAGGVVYYLSLGGGRVLLLNPPVDPETEEPITEEEERQEHDPWYVNLAINLALMAGAKVVAKAAKSAAKSAGLIKDTAKVATTATKEAAAGTKAATSAVEGTKAIVEAGKESVTGTKAAASAAEGTKAASSAAEGTKAAASAAEGAKAAATTVKESVKGAEVLAKTSTAAVGSTAAVAKAARSLEASKLLAKLSGGPAQIISMAIAFILQDTLDLHDDAFKDCPGDGMWALNSLPLAASISIQLVPFLGDVFMLMEPVTCFQTGCKPGMGEEGGLCYKPCDPGFKSDGATLCYKQYPEFEGNGQLHTLTNITKEVRIDTGTLPTECDGEIIAGLCYTRCESGFSGELDRCYRNCPPGTVNTGYRCEKDSYGRGVGRIPDKGPCPPGLRDDGISCWNDNIHCHTGGGDCRTWGDGCCSRGLFNECYGCLRTECSPIFTKCEGGIERTLFQRQSCGPNEEMVNGLCYPRCREGYFGEGPVCWSSAGPFDREVKNRGVGRLLSCPGGKENIAGLCYGSIPNGYSRQTVGLLSQNCPPGTTDMGVGCVRESYTRGGGLVPLDIVIKERK